MADVKDEKTLLSLPAELLSLIAICLNDEVLTSFRLSCKKLEAACFDQFIGCHCVDRRCFVFSIDRWTQLQTQFEQSPRLTSKLRRLTLTTDTWEQHDCETVPFAQVSGTRYSSGAQYFAQQKLNSEGELSNHLRGGRRPRLANIVGVLGLLQTQPIKATVDLDFSGSTTLLSQDQLLFDDIVNAVVSTNLAIGSLRVSPACLPGLKAVLALYRSSHPAHAISLTRLDYDMSYNYEATSEYVAVRYKEKRLDLLHEALRRPNELRSLNISLRGIRTWQRELLCCRILTSIGGQSLSEISVSWMAVPDNILQSVLITSQSTLTRVELGHIRLSKTARGWSGIFQTIHEMLNIHFLHLSHLTSKMSPLDEGVPYPSIDFTPLAQRGISMPMNPTLAKTCAILKGNSAVKAGIRLLDG